MPDRSPYTTVGLGLLGTEPSQDAMQECDTLLIAGTAFPYTEFYPKPDQAKAMQIDIDPTRIGPRYPAQTGLVGDCQSNLRALNPLVNRNEDRSFLEKAQKRMKAWNELMEERGTRTDMPNEPPLPGNISAEQALHFAGGLARG